MQMSGAAVGELGVFERNPQGPRRGGEGRPWTLIKVTRQEQLQHLSHSRTLTRTHIFSTLCWAWLRPPCDQAYWDFISETSCSWIIHNIPW